MQTKENIFLMTPPNLIQLKLCLRLNNGCFTQINQQEDHNSQQVTERHHLFTFPNCVCELWIGVPGNVGELIRQQMKASHRWRPLASCKRIQANVCAFALILFTSLEVLKDQWNLTMSCLFGKSKKRKKVEKQRRAYH